MRRTLLRSCPHFGTRSCVFDVWLINVYEYARIFRAVRSRNLHSSRQRFVPSFGNVHYLSQNQDALRKPCHKLTLVTTHIKLSPVLPTRSV
jgi:hypothetical protein